MAPQPLPVPPANPNADWTAAEKKFFEDNGVTDEREKEIIRGRARVMAYDRARQKYENDNSPPPPEKKKWYQED